jgi:hypothetical protein
MEKTNDYLVSEKKPRDNEDKTYQEGKKVWIPFEKISWAPIFAGVLVTTITQMLLSLLGLGIGLATIDPLREYNPADGLGMGTLIWWSVTMLISLFFGGLTTGRMYQAKSKMYLTWHGFLTWCAFAVFSFFMLTTSVGKLISGTGNIINTILTTGASVTKNNNALDISRITRDARNLFVTPSTNTTDDFSTDPSTNNNVADNTGANRRFNNQPNNNQSLIEEVQSFFRGENVQNTEDRESLIRSLVAQTGMSRAEANSKVDEWTNSYKNIQEDARVAADKAARAMSMASLIAFFALIVGALVTIWGARAAWQEKEFAKIRS